MKEGNVSYREAHAVSMGGLGCHVQKGCRQLKEGVVKKLVDAIVLLVCRSRVAKVARCHMFEAFN
jgi:hypothetical protein